MCLHKQFIYGEFLPQKKIFITLKNTLFFWVHLKYSCLIFVFLHFWSVILFLAGWCFPSQICCKIDGLKPSTSAFLLLRVRIMLGSTLGQKGIRLVFSDCVWIHISRTHENWGDFFCCPPRPVDLYGLFPVVVLSS